MGNNSKSFGKGKWVSPNPYTKLKTAWRVCLIYTKSNISRVFKDLVTRHTTQDFMTSRIQFLVILSKMFRNSIKNKVFMEFRFDKTLDKIPMFFVRKDLI